MKDTGNIFCNFVSAFLVTTNGYHDHLHNCGAKKLQLFMDI